MTDLPETNEILNTGLGSGKPYLGSPKIVQAIIREYLHDLSTLRSEQVQRGADPVPQIKGMAERLQQVFYGKDDRYQAFAWNRESSLGRALVEDCDIGGDASDAVFRLGGNVPPGAEIRIRVVLEPTRDAIGVPDHVLDLYGEAIADGAIASMMLLTGQPFSNPQLAGAHAGAFHAAITGAHTREWRSRTNVTPRVRPTWC